MKKSLVAVIVAAVALLAIAGIVIAGSKSKDASTNQSPSSNSAGNSTKEAPGASANMVAIKDFAFAPMKLTIKKGTKVTWVNNDSAHHDISPDAGSSDAFKASELLGKGESYSFTFTTAGTYAYHCTPHPYMKAMIEVTE